MARSLLALLALLFASPILAGDRQLYWGDTHVHTSNSFDAFSRLNRSADPETAYRYASGLPVLHPYHRARIRIDTPLDFLVVADHAEYMGVFRTIMDSGIPKDGLSPAEMARSQEAEGWIRELMESGTWGEFSARVLPNISEPMEAARESYLDTAVVPNYGLMIRNTWNDYTAMADTYYRPGEFTTLIGWEWSPIPGGANLHRVVFTTADAEVAQTFTPFHMGHSPYPEDLWSWLDDVSEKTRAEFVAIPHNSNISKGYMFPEVTIKGQPVTVDYARSRLKWEPVAETTQIKGDSETIGVLSPGDEFADFETYPHYIQPHLEEYKPTAGDYIRSGLKRGLEMEQKLGVNPFKFGLIGSTDAHTGMASAEEQNFHGKFARDGVPENKLRSPDTPERPSGWAMSAQGLAAVWAEHNDRESIMAAFKRREVYATTGPRIQLRFFGGWDFEASDIESADYADIGYRKGVAMGGDLLAERLNRAPSFMVHAARDPKGANLDRIQIVKGWLDDKGEARERVFDVAWAGDRTPNDEGRLPPIGSTVDTSNATYSNTIGSEQLSAVWTDPEFDHDQRALYYVRVIQIPTPRHALADALAMGMSEPDRGPLIIQERAYSSPIWFTP